MHHVVRKNIALALIVLDVIIAIATRNHSQNVFIWGNNICLVLLSVSAILVSDGFDRVIATAVSVYMLGISTDTAFFHVMDWQINDTITACVAVIIAAVVYARYKPTPRINVNSVLLLLLLAVKIATQHSYASFVRNNEVIYVALVGNIITHFLFATYLIWQLKGYMIEIPLILWMLSLNKTITDLCDVSYRWDFQEIRLVILFAIVLIWWVLYRYLYKKQIMFHVLGALAILFFAFCFFGFI